MTITLNLPPEKEAAFKAQAQARGLTLEQWFLEVADQHAQPVSIAHLQRTDPQEWARQFDAWADSHDPNIPVLSDEAMSRESIYPNLTQSFQPPRQKCRAPSGKFENSICLHIKHLPTFRPETRYPMC